MGLTTKGLQSQIVTKDSLHYYEIKNEDGQRYCHCGSMKDVEDLISMHSNFTYEKIYLPAPPKTVDVPHVAVAPDFELPMQQSLPQSELQPLDL
jgi:hypothetical protein